MGKPERGEPDTIPALFAKLKNKKAKWLISVYHFIPNPSKRPGGLALNNLLSFFSQRISLFFIARFGDVIHTETSFVKDELVKQYGIPSEKIFACQSGIDTKAIDSVQWSEGKLYDACFLARLHKSKGIYDLIEAWKYVCQTNKSAKLAIAGSGGSAELIEELKGKIRDSNLENNVFFLGFLPEENKFKLLKACKLYILPSYEEGIPITFNEAMYCGLPIITYYLPTYAEINDFIVSVAVGDVKELAFQISKMLKDTKSMQGISVRAKKQATEHTWDRVANLVFSKIKAQ